MALHVHSTITIPQQNSLVGNLDIVPGLFNVAKSLLAVVLSHVVVVCDCCCIHGTSVASQKADMAWICMPVRECTKRRTINRFDRTFCGYTPGVSVSVCLTSGSTNHPKHSTNAGRPVNVPASAHLRRYPREGRELNCGPFV